MAGRVGLHPGVERVLLPCCPLGVPRTSGDLPEASHLVHAGEPELVGCGDGRKAVDIVGGGMDDERLLRTRQVLYLCGVPLDVVLQRVLRDDQAVGVHPPVVHLSDGVQNGNGLAVLEPVHVIRVPEPRHPVDPPAVSAQRRQDALGPRRVAGRVVGQRVVQEVQAACRAGLVGGPCTARREREPLHGQLTVGEDGALGLPVLPDV